MEKKTYTNRRFASKEMIVRWFITAVGPSADGHYSKRSLIYKYKLLVMRLKLKKDREWRFINREGGRGGEKSPKRGAIEALPV